MDGGRLCVRAERVGSSGLKDASSGADPFLVGIVLKTVQVRPNTVDLASPPGELRRGLTPGAGREDGAFGETRSGQLFVIASAIA
jgi:hypothetical protein